MGDVKRDRTIHYTQSAHLLTPPRDTKTSKNEVMLQSFAESQISLEFP